MDMTQSNENPENREALNELLNFINSDQFLELSSAERQPHLQKLKQLICGLLDASPVAVL